MKRTAIQKQYSEVLLKFMENRACPSGSVWRNYVNSSSCADLVWSLRWWGIYGPDPMKTWKVCIDITRKGSVLLEIASPHMTLRRVITATKIVDGCIVDELPAGMLGLPIESGTVDTVCDSITSTCEQWRTLLHGWYVSAA